MKSTRTIIILVLGLIGLALVYIFQRSNYSLALLQAMGVEEPSEKLVFIISKIVRLLLNDLICFFMIYSIFKERSCRQVAAFVFVVELFVVLPIYLVLKLNIEGTSELSTPMLSFIHRLIINPTLMILTGLALGYQKFIFPTLRKS
jgi:exosortase F-associated protein